SRSRSAPVHALRGDGASGDRVGCSADCRGVSVGRKPKVPGARPRCHPRRGGEAAPSWPGHPAPTRATEVPWQNAYVERLIGSVRRECIDHVIVLGESYLRRIMSRYAEYYNETRTYLSPGKDAPIGRAIERFDQIVARPMVGGLHHRYTRI